MDQQIRQSRGQRRRILSLSSRRTDTTSTTINDTFLFLFTQIENYMYEIKVKKRCAVQWNGRRPILIIYVAIKTVTNINVALFLVCAAKKLPRHENWNVSSEMWTFELKNKRKVSSKQHLWNILTKTSEFKVYGVKLLEHNRSNLHILRGWNRKFETLLT